MKLERLISGIPVRAEILCLVEGVPIIRIENGPIQALNDWDRGEWQLSDPFPTFPERWMAIWTSSAPRLFTTEANALSAIDAGGRAADYILHVWSTPKFGPAGEFAFGLGPFQS